MSESFSPSPAMVDHLSWLETFDHGRIGADIVETVLKGAVTYLSDPKNAKDAAAFADSFLDGRDNGFNHGMGNVSKWREWTLRGQDFEPKGGARNADGSSKLS